MGHDLPYFVRKYELCLIFYPEMDRKYVFYVAMCGEIPTNTSLLVVYYPCMMIKFDFRLFRVIYGQQFSIFRKKS